MYRMGPEGTRSLPGNRKLDVKNSLEKFGELKKRWKFYVD